MPARNGLVTWPWPLGQCQNDKKSYNVDNMRQFHNHFIPVTQGRSNISWCVLKTLYCSEKNYICHTWLGAYFAQAVIYTRKMFKKLAKGADVI